jgi:flagellar protein FliS
VVKGNRGANAYRRMEAESRSPMELVVMLYDGAIRFVADARNAIARSDVHARTAATRRALDIVSELQNTLNVKEGGDIARELDRLYGYMSTRLLDVTRGDAGAADEIHKLLCTLRDGFAQAATSAMPAAK